MGLPPIRVMAKRVRLGFWTRTAVLTVFARLIGVLLRHGGRAGAGGAVGRFASQLPEIRHWLILFLGLRGAFFVARWFHGLMGAGEGLAEPMRRWARRFHAACAPSRAAGHSRVPPFFSYCWRSRGSASAKVPPSTPCRA